jgi:hypothetical protein
MGRRLRRLGADDGSGTQSASGNSPAVALEQPTRQAKVQQSQVGPWRIGAAGFAVPMVLVEHNAALAPAVA